MHVDRTALALTRIETAVRRITEAARSGRTAGDTEGGAQYQALRRETAAALAEIDHLIRRLEA